MLPDRVSNPGPLTYESGALPIALRGPAHQKEQSMVYTVCYQKEQSMVYTVCHLKEQSNYGLHCVSLQKSSLWSTLCVIRRISLIMVYTVSHQ